MKDAPRKTLCNLIAKYGRAVVEDPQRCEGFLRDFCGEQKREISVLVSALKEGVAAELLVQSAGTPTPVLVARLTRRLMDNRGLAEDAARWAVESWVQALGRGTASPLAAANRLQTPTPGPWRRSVKTLAWVGGAGLIGAAIGLYGLWAGYLGPIAGPAASRGHGPVSMEKPKAVQPTPVVPAPQKPAPAPAKVGRAESAPRRKPPGEAAPPAVGPAPPPAVSEGASSPPRILDAGESQGVRGPSEMRQEIERLFRQHNLEGISVEVDSGLAVVLRRKDWDEETVSKAIRLVLSVPGVTTVTHGAAP